MDPMRAIGIILVVSFLLDQVVKGLFFLLDYSAEWRKFLPDPELIEDAAAKASAERRRKVIYALLVGFLGTVVVAGYLHIRILGMTNMIPADPGPPDPKDSAFQPHELLDILFTGLIFTAGADRLSEALKLLGGSGAEHASDKASSAKPVEITGRLVLEREHDATLHNG